MKTSSMAGSRRRLGTGLRALGAPFSAIGLALLLALAAPLHLAHAAPSAAQAPAGFSQEPVDTTDMDAPWPGDDDDSDQTTPPDNATPPGDQGPGLQGTDQNAPAPAAPETKGVTAEPDSLLKAKAATPQTGGAALDTLQFKAPTNSAAAAAARRRAAEAKPPVKRTFFGLHPAVFFLGMVIGHIAIVKAVNH